MDTRMGPSINQGGFADPGVAGAEPPAAPLLLLASANPGKLRELRGLLADLDLRLLGPDERGLALEVEETGASFLDNALLKALAFAQASGLPALADDSGLEVDALDGEPGLRSARWAPGSDADRCAALLARMAGLPPARRGARYRAVLALAWPEGRVAWAEGRVEGRIASAPRGSGGFGYDPLFLVEDGGLDGSRTMAELPPAEKARLSHRARALAALRPALGALGAGGIGQERRGSAAGAE